MLKQSHTLIILLITLSLIAAQCSNSTTANNATQTDGSTIKIMDPFARASMPNGAVYMHLMNEGDTDDQLIGAETTVAQTVELHETKIDENEVMRMSPVEMIPLPAGGSATLQPGGLHVMLLGLKEELATGDTFQLTLNFKNSGPQTLEVTVKEGMGMKQ